jgi:hypothetical protein
MSLHKLGNVEDLGEFRVCCFWLLHLSHFIATICIKVLYIFPIYTNTPPKDGLKIYVMPILLQIDSFSLEPNPFVKQAAS